MSGELSFGSLKILFVFIAVFIMLPNPVFVNTDSTTNDFNELSLSKYDEVPANSQAKGVGDETLTGSVARAIPFVSSDVWLQRSQPSARSEHAIVFDSAGGKLYMYGGWDLSNELSDLWVLDSTTNKWEDLNDGIGPGGRHDHSMIFEPTTSKLYLFGGYDGNDMQNDLWMYNISRSAWVLVDHGSGGAAPNARSGHGMVYDSGQHAIYIFGGTNGPSYFNDVWKFDLAAQLWSEMTVTVTKPTGRTQLDMVYDSTNNNIYVFGGFDGNNYLEDLWKFEVGINAWSSVTPAGTRPPERSDHTMAYHKSGDRVYMFGGIYRTISDIKEYRADFWYYDIGSNQWHQPEDGPSPSPRARHAMAVDQANGEIYISEGYSGEFREDLWKYKTAQNRWENIYDSSPVSSPSIRNGQGLVFDPVENCLYYFGGYYNDGQPHYREDMWRFDLTTNLWTLVNEGTGPEARFARGVVYDSAAHEIYMFGGYYYDFFGGTRNYLNDLWLYNITTFSWQEVNDGSTVPEPRDGHRMIYDPAGGDIYLHGGRKWISSGNYKYYGDLWRYDVAGQSWTNLTDSTTISGRSRQSMCFDSRHGDIYVFGGFNASGYNNETWKYNIATNNWTLLSPIGTVPSMRGAHDLVYDSANDNIYLFSGKNQDSPNPVVLNDFYMYNVSTQNWSQISLPAGSAPIPRIQYGIAYDRFTSVFYLSGGYYYDTADRFYADLWQYEPATGNWTEIKVKRPYPNPGLDGTMISGGSGSEIYQFGGWDGTDYQDRLWILDKTTNEYMVYDPDTEERPAGRRSHGMAYDGSATFFIFGGTNGTYLNDMWTFIQGIVKWQRITPVGLVPPGRERFQMVYGGSQTIYMFSGWAGSSIDDFWKYDISANSWTELTPSGTKPSARQRYSMVADTQGGYLYLFGGFDSTLKYKNDLWRYDIAGNTWTELSGYIGQAPSARDGMGMWYEPESNSIFILGGKDSSGLYSDFHKFDIDNNLWIKVSTENAEPSPRHSFAHTYDEDTRTIFTYGGWSNYYKGDIWTWMVASNPGIKDVNVNLLDGDSPFNRTIYTMYRFYEFAIKVKDATSYKNIERVNLTFDSGDGTIMFQWIEETDEFVKVGDTEDVLILSEDSYSEHDTSQTYTLHFKIKFNWTYTKEGLQGLEIQAESDNQGADTTLGHYFMFEVENDLDFKGNLEVFGSVQGQLYDGDWVKKEEVITLENLTVVYQGTSDIYPQEDQFNVAVWDDDGRVWVDTESSGTDISIQTTADNITDLTEDYVINITKIPSSNDNTTQTFTLKVDADPVQFADAEPPSTVLNNALTVECRITITDGISSQSSGVDASTIEYSISTNGGGTWSAWASAGETGITDTASPAVDVEFANTFNNFIRWRATDAVGNELSTSADFKVPVDTSYSPSAPTTLLMSPFDASEVSTLTPLMVWSGEDPENDDINYDIYIGLDEDKVRDRDNSLKVVSGLETSFYFVTNSLRDGLKHYWTVIPHDETYTGRCVSDVWEFTPHSTLAAVPNATLVQPEDGSIQDTLTPALEWLLNNTGAEVVNNLVIVYTAGDQGGGGALVTEEIILAEFQSSQLGNKITVPMSMLEDNTNYEWLVLPHSGGKRGLCENGPFGFFTNTSYKVIFNIELLAPEDLPVTPGRNSSTSVTIKNTGNVEDTFELTIDAGTIGDYITFEYTGGGLVLGPGAERKLNIALDIPESFEPGEYPLKITAASQGSGGTVSVDTTIKIIIEGEDTIVEPTDEEGLNTMLIAGIGIVIVIVVILLLMFLVIIPKKKKSEEVIVPLEQRIVQPGEVSAEVSYIPKGAFESERAAFSAVTGQPGGVGAQYPELPGVAGTEGAAGGVVTPTEPLPPQAPEEPFVEPEQLPETPVSPYEGAPTETPVEPPSPEGWEQAPQLPPADGEQPPEEEPVRYDTGEGETPQPPPEQEPQQPTAEPDQEQQYYQQQQEQYQQEQPQQPQAPAYTPCAYCGAQVPYGNQYCTSCGVQLF